MTLHRLDSLSRSLQNQQDDRILIGHIALQVGQMRFK